MTRLKLSLLGGFELAADDKPVVIPARKARALLAFLALGPDQPRHRDQLAGLLWDDRDDTRARGSLRQALALLRRVLPGAVPLIRADGDLLHLEHEVLEVDVARFEVLAQSASESDLQQAAALYRGDLLEGLYTGAAAFDDWLGMERSRLRELALSTLARLLEQLLAARATEPAIGVAIRLLALDPLRESAHRALMRLYAQQGRAGQALRQYRICREVLRRELGLAPEAATDALYREIARERQRPDSGEPLEDIDAQGTAPSAPAEAETPAAVPRPSLRQATFMACEMTGLTGPDADPELLHEQIGAFHEAAATLVERFEGELIERGGGRVLAVFGVPRSRDHDMERAVRCAVHLRAGIAGNRLRAAVACGQVVAGGQTHTLSSPAAALAGELCRGAPAGSVLLSAPVYHGLADRLEAEPLDTGAGAALRFLGWLDQASSPLRPPFCGRRTEILQFQGLLVACRESGSGQAILLRGESGIGKSRLAREWLGMAHAQGFAVHAVTVDAFGAGRGEQAVAGITGALIPDADEDLPAVLSSAADRRFLQDLLGRPADEPATTLPPEERRRGARELLRRLLVVRAARQPCCLLIEDVHWLEAPALETLAVVAEATRDCQAMLIMTCRAGSEAERPSWRAVLSGVPLLTLDLGPLREDEARHLAEQFAFADGEFRARCIARARGNPLFLEQLLRSGASGDRVPDSIQAVVWARLDSLDEVDRYALQAASVLGLRFQPEALHHLTELPGYHPDAALNRGLLRPDGDALRFSHSLIRDAVYQSLLRNARRQLHRRAAEWFSCTDPALAAEHLACAEDAAAAGALLAAARDQARQYRHERALALVERGLAGAQGPEADELQLLRAQILLDMGATAEATAAFRQAAAMIANPVHRCHALIGQAVGMIVTDHNAEALHVLDDAEALASRLGLEAALAQIHYNRGNALFPLGEMDRCLAEHQKACELARRIGSVRDEARALSGLADAYYQRGHMRTAHGFFEATVRLAREHDLPGVEAVNLAMQGATRFYCGELLQAIELAGEAVRRAEAVGDRWAEMMGCDVLCGLLSYRGDWAETAAVAARALALARSFGTRRFEAEMLGIAGYAQAAGGELEGGLETLRRAIELSRAAGETFTMPWLLGCLAVVDPDRARRIAALDQGEALLARGSLSHNYLHFYQLAMDAALQLPDLDRVLRYASALETYTAQEPLPWATFHAARARALVEAAARPQDPDLHARLEQLAGEARRRGLVLAEPALIEAIPATGGAETPAAHPGQGCA